MLGMDVRYYNLSLGIALVDYLWTFGDRVTSTLAHPTHSYAAIGDYTVTLTVSTPFGTDTTALGIQVITPTIYLPIVLKDD